MNRRIVSVLCVIIGLFVSMSSCRKMSFYDEDFSVAVLNGSGSYESVTNKSTLKISSRIIIRQPNIANDPLTLSFTGWEFQLLAGSTLVQTVNTSNYKQLLGNTIVLDISSPSVDYMWVNLETIIPVPGDIYMGANPNAIKMIYYFKDNKNNSYKFNPSNTGAFQFIRQ